MTQGPDIPGEISPMDITSGEDRPWLSGIDFGSYNGLINKISYRAGAGIRVLIVTVLISILLSNSVEIYRLKNRLDKLEEVYGN